jgi:tRNA (guanine-N7-)-methyltransferase
MPGQAQKRRRRQEYQEALKVAQVEGSETQFPQKRFFRQRAHANVFSDHHLD